MSQKRIHRQYTKEFKEETVVLVLEQGYCAPEAARLVGISAELHIAMDEEAPISPDTSLRLRGLPE